MSKPEPTFYLRDTRSNVGSTCMFWALNGHGYTSDLGKAEVFSHEEAQEYADQQRHFIPLHKAKVDELATVRVDMQYLKMLNVDFSKGIIVQRHVGKYDNNDIYFDDGLGGYTPDYAKAKVYESVDAISALTNQAGAIHSKVFLDSICRPTLQVGNVNHRTMMTSAGIRYRAPRKSYAKGMTRGNCPECGQITWDYNPYENAYCKHHSP